MAALRRLMRVGASVYGGRFEGLNGRGWPSFRQTMFISIPCSASPTRGVACAQSLRRRGITARFKYESRRKRLLVFGVGPSVALARLVLPTGNDLVDRRLRAVIRLASRLGTPKRREEWGV